MADDTYGQTLEAIDKIDQALKLNETKKRLSKADVQYLLDVRKALKKGGIATGGVGHMLQGASLYLGDEAVAGVRSALGPLNYDTALALERQGLKQFETENPGQAKLAQFGGAMLPSMAMPASGSIRGAMAIGAAEGGAAGFGAGEGVEDRATQAAIAAPVGAVVGGGAQVAINGARALGRGAKSLLPGAAARKGRAYGDNIVLEMLAADNPDIKAVLQDMRAGNRPEGYAVADTGDNARAGLQAAGNMPGPGLAAAQQFSKNRMTTGNQRLDNMLAAEFGDNGKYWDNFKAMKQARSDQGGKLYDVAFSRDFMNVDAETVDLMRTPAVQAAWKIGQRIAKNNGQRVSKLNPAAPTLEQMHYIKMGLDGAVFGNQIGDGIANVERNSINDVRKRLLAKMDDLSPAYKIARDQWAGDTAMINAMQEGRRVFRPGDIEGIDMLEDRVAGMSKSEHEAFRAGLLQGLIDQAEKGVDTSNGARNLIKSRSRRRIIRLMFPDGRAGTKKFDEFVGKLEQQAEMYDTDQAVTRGSRTAPMSDMIKDIKSGVAQQGVPSSAFELVNRLLQNSLRDEGERTVRAATEQIVNHLTATTPKQLKSIERLLAGNKPAQAMKVLSRVMDSASGAAAATAGSEADVFTRGRWEALLAEATR